MEFLIIFFLLHWYGSLFCQSFFLHRYSAHRIFTMSPRWEKFFYWLTFITQGSSYLNPRAYGIMHNHHHQFSDTEKDPHSPHFSSNPMQMMLKTADYYQELVDSKDPKHHVNQVHNSFLDSYGETWTVRILWGVAYVAVYWAFAPTWHWYLLLPIHFLMGPIHGAVVNWCGHKMGYRNHKTPDKSVNTLPVDIFLMGELYQNNHHQNAKSPNFASKWWELDPTYPVMVFLHWTKVISLKQILDFEQVLEQVKGSTRTQWLDLCSKFRHNQELANKMLKTRSEKAQSFAIAIADVKKMSSQRLDRWAREISDLKCRQVFVSDIVMDSKHGYKKLQKWTRSRSLKFKKCGYQLLNSYAVKDIKLSHEDWVRFLEQIVKQFRNASEEVKALMKSAYQRIATRSDELAQKARELAIHQQGLLAA